MPHIPNHRKVKRATLITKRTQCLKNFSKTKFYKPSYRKLKSNNSSLAKALSKEKEENQLLFTRNVALVAELQDLGQACSKRDTVISDVLRNAKEILKMIVTMSSYVTNTISSCQEFASSANTDLMRLSCNSVENRDSYRRLSTKSPARGVVKPMVSGHTITKPTINLSRVNMQRINPSSLSTILETPPTPERSSEINEIRAPVNNVSLDRQIRYVNSSMQGAPKQENRRAPRMPERLIISTSRSNEEDERRLSKRSSRRSARMSGRYSRPKSGRLSGSHVPRFSLENMGNVGSPRVKLNDVSKLLQNSHSVNVRTLSENINSTWANESQQSNNETAVEDNSSENIVIAETRMDSADTEEEEEDKSNNAANSTKETDESVNEESRESTADKTRESNRHLQSSWDDPLEGPSWLFNIDQTSVSSRSRSSLRESTKANVTPQALESDDSCDSTNDTSTTSLPNAIRNTDEPDECEKSLVNGEVSQNSDDSGTMEDRNFSAALQMNVNNHRRNGMDSRRDNEPTVNFSRFVNCMRSKSLDDEEEDIDDFTLMYMKEPNMNFDINDLRLPVLEEPMLPQDNIDEPEPEITATIPRITQTVPLPSVSNTMDDSMFEQSIAMRLPSLANEHNVDLTPISNKSDVKRKRGFKKENLPDLSDIRESGSLNATVIKQKKRSSSDKDPSAVKVVLQKLQESFVQQRTSQDDFHIRESSRSFRKCTLSPRGDNYSDSDSSSTSINSRMAQNRPKRRKAPMNLQEPKLNTKLRRRE